MRVHIFSAGVKLSDTDMQKFVSETYSGVYLAMCLERGKPVAVNSSIEVARVAPTTILTGKSGQVIGTQCICLVSGDLACTEHRPYQMNILLGDEFTAALDYIYSLSGDVSNVVLNDYQNKVASLMVAMPDELDIITNSFKVKLGTEVSVTLICGCPTVL